MIPSARLVHRSRRTAPLAAAALLLPLAMVPMTTAAAAEEVFSTSVSDDSYTTSTVPNRNSGSSDKVAVGYDGWADKVGYFKFDVSAGEGQNPTLVLTITGGTAGELTVHTTSSDWEDRTITHANAPAPSDQVGQVSVAGGSQTVTIPLDLSSIDSAEQVSLAVKRTDGGLSRIGSQEASSSVGAELRMQSKPVITLPVPVSDDSYTTSTVPTRNSGGSDKVAVGYDGWADKVGYFKFDASATQVKNPELVLTVTGGTAGQLSVHATSSDWQDRTITHANAPAPIAQVGQASVSGGSQTVTIPLDLTNAGSAQQISLSVKRTDGGITRIASQEASGNGGAVLREHSEADPVTRDLPVYVSPEPDSGTYLQSYEARRAQGWASALYTYWPGDIKWNSEWQGFVQRHPAGIPVLGSPKGVNPANVTGFLDNLPQAWRDQWIMTYYQEPEDNFTTPAARAEFRTRVSQMADLVRPYGVDNAVHLQEWTINPVNRREWAGEQALSEFFDVEDIDYLSWSLYPAEGESMRPGIDRIKAFSEKYAPGIPWGVTAAGSPVDGSAPIGGQDRAERAAIVLDGAQYVAEVGGQAFGWFDWDEYLPGQDNLVSKDPALQDVFGRISTLSLSER